MQLLNHMEHIHRLAIETMERRISITDGFQQYLVELKSTDEEERESTAKRLMEEQRTTAFYETPRALLRREEQRQAMKEFVRHLESQILEASTCSCSRVFECSLITHHIQTQIRPYVRFIVWTARSLLRYL